MNSLYHARRSEIVDRDLLASIAADDRVALATLYKDYHSRLCRFLSRLTRRTDVIEEAVNDVFLAIWQKAGDFRGDSRVSTWIMGIAYRCGLKAMQRHGNDPVQDDNISQNRIPIIDPDEDRVLSDWLAKGLEQLTTDQRVVVELVYGSGHSLDEVAFIMDCALVTVQARLFHARNKLRDVLPGLAGGTFDLEHSHHNYFRSIDPI
jgi:RNA polymerase sigma-70 factor (ECF subfamily)